MKKTMMATITCAVLICCLSVGAFAAAGCTGTVDTNDATYKTDLDGIKNLHIIADGSGENRGGSGVTVIFCDDHDGLLLEYQKAVHSYQVEKEGDTATIRLTGKLGRKEDVVRRVMSRMVLHLPRRAYDQIKVEGIQAGVSVEAVNADLVVSNQKGAMSVSLPKNYSKTLDYSCDKGASSLSLHPDAADYTLKVDATGSAVSMPEDLPAFSYVGAYQYVNGTGKAAINLTVQSCAMLVDKGKD